MLPLHRGAEFPHNDLKPLAVQPEGLRRIVSYDQIRCGNSDRPDNPPLRDSAVFLNEIATAEKAPAHQVRGTQQEEKPQA